VGLWRTTAKKAHKGGAEGKREEEEAMIKGEGGRSSSLKVENLSLVLAERLGSQSAPYAPPPKPVRGHSFLGR